MTTTVSTSVFLPLVQPWVQGAPLKGIREEIARACVRFCEETLVWKEQAPPTSVVAGTHTYTIPTPTVPSPTQAQVALLEEVYFDEFPLPPVTMYELRQWHTDWATAVGTPTRYTQENPNAIRLVPIPQTNDALTDGLTMRVAYKPIMTATLVPDFLFSQYGFAVAAGAIAALASMKGRAWYDPNIARFYMSKYHEGATAAKIDAAKSFTRAPRQVWRKFV